MLWRRYVAALVKKMAEMKENFAKTDIKKLFDEIQNDEQEIQTIYNELPKIEQHLKIAEQLNTNVELKKEIQKVFLQYAEELKRYILLIEKSPNVQEFSSMIRKMVSQISKIQSEDKALELLNKIKNNEDFAEQSTLKNFDNSIKECVELLRKYYALPPSIADFSEYVDTIDVVKNLINNQITNLASNINAKRLANRKENPNNNGNVSQRIENLQSITSIDPKQNQLDAKNNNSVEGVAEGIQEFANFFSGRPFKNQFVIVPNKTDNENNSSSDSEEETTNNSQSFSSNNSLQPLPSDYAKLVIERARNSKNLLFKMIANGSSLPEIIKYIQTDDYKSTFHLDEDGNGAIHLAVLTGHKEAEQWLMFSCGIPAKPNKYGYKPAQLLGIQITSHAEKNKENPQNAYQTSIGNAFTKWALWENMGELRKQINSLTESVDIRDSKNQTALMYVSQAGNFDMVTELVEIYGANIHATNSQGNKPIHFAAMSRADGHPKEKYEKVMRYLIEKGASPNETNQQGKTALELGKFAKDHKFNIPGIDKESSNQKLSAPSTVSGIKIASTYANLGNSQLYPKTIFPKIPTTSTSSSKDTNGGQVIIKTDTVAVSMPQNVSKNFGIKKIKQEIQNGVNTNPLYTLLVEKLGMEGLSEKIKTFIKNEMSAQLKNPIKNPEYELLLEKIGQSDSELDDFLCDEMQEFRKSQQNSSSAFFDKYLNYPGVESVRFESRSIGVEIKGEEDKDNVSESNLSPF